jgi:uncharacterized membrane protein
MLSAGEWVLLPVPLNKPRGKEEKYVNTKDLFLMTLYAALYAVLVVFFQPISFSVLQFKVAGILRPGIAKEKELALAYALGVVVANIYSPFTGPYE